MTTDKSGKTAADQHQVQIRMRASGASLEVDGHDISDGISAYTLHQAAGQPAQMVVQVSGEATRNGVLDGLAHVVVGEAPHPGDAASVFLSSIDPGQLEQAALRRHDLMTGGPHEMTRVMLTQLIEWARGTADDAQEALAR
ncbi:hypothetical protein [Streptomyces sp. NPDC056308]|uniref:hypothetical protein n=1 Tax=Streptomyces sp. NPDC056308 TaxID=3345780 RepID=UPI0035D5FE23